MDLSTISVRYAKALYLLAKEKKLLDQVKNDIQLISGMLNSSPDFKAAIESPVIKPSEKVKAAFAIYQGKIQDMTLSFLNLLIKNKREQSLEGICRRFLAIYSQEKGIKTAVITTAVPLDENVSKKISELLALQFKAQIEIEHKQDPDILGGYILRVGDKQYDASVASSLRRLKQNLLKSDFSKN